MIEAQTENSPLGVIDSLSSGFSALAQKPGLLLIPFLLDLFLWLGPRLSVAPIVPELSTRLRDLAGQAAENSAEIFEQNLSEILDSVNLFSALSTWPLGTPSLLAGNDPGIGPFGPPPKIQVGGLGEFLLWLLVLSLSGLLLGNLYLGLIARWIDDNPSGFGTWSKRIWFQWLRILVFVLGVLLGAFLLSMPFFLALEFAAFIFAPLAPLLLLVGVGVGMWGLFHLFFVVHGILVDDLSIAQAVTNSVHLVRRYPFSSVGLLVVAVLISLGLNRIWHLPSSQSWMRVVAIAGNAFVNTGLATATFVYYTERTATEQPDDGTPPPQGDEA